MADPAEPTGWRNPRIVAAAVGVIAAAVLYALSAATTVGPTTGEVSFVLLFILGPTTVAYELARRLQ